MMVVWLVASVQIGSVPVKVATLVDPEGNVLEIMELPGAWGTSGILKRIATALTVRENTVELGSRLAAVPRLV